MTKGARVSLAVAVGLPALCPLAHTAAQGVNSLRNWNASSSSSETGPYKAVAAGKDFTIAIISSSDPSLDSTLAGWGTVSHGTTGYSFGHPLTGGGCDTCVPAPAPGTKVKAIAAGREHMAAILEDDTVYCWGVQFATDITAPQGVRFKAISAGEGFTAGIVLDPNNSAIDGTMRIWGSNYDFSLGCGSTLPVPAPAGKFLAIAAGGHHLIAIRAEDRTLWRLGSTCGTYQAAYGNVVGGVAPPGGTFRAVAAGHFHSLAIKDDWTLVRWDGQPGWLVTTQAPPGGQFTAIASGYAYNMALHGNGTIETWGCISGTASCGPNPSPPAPPAGPPQLEYGKIRAGYYRAVGVINCYGNCDGSAVEPIYNVLDYNCFTNRFANGDPWANCDGSTIPPVLNVLDFMCFNNMFAACSPD